MVVMNAATSVVTEKSPYIVRTSLTIPQLNYAFGKWAFREGGVKQAYTLVADYGPGIDAEKSFAKGFTEAGGKIVGADSTPVANPDFSAFVQRVKDANPEAVYIFIPGGAQPAAIGKALADRGLTPPATKVLAQGELTHPEALESMGETAKRHHHHLPLHARARRPAEQGVRRRLPRGQQRPQPRPLLDRRL